MKRDELARRRARARRLAAKRPPIAVDVTYAPCPAARERLLELLLELLDARRNSGGGWKR